MIPPSIFKRWLTEHAAPHTPCNVGKICCVAFSGIPAFLYVSDRTLFMQESIIRPVSSSLRMASRAAVMRFGLERLRTPEPIS
jgi:hypothetical protein